MKITSYNVKINGETKRNELVKEKTFNYSDCKGLNNPETIVNTINDMLDLQHMAEEYMYLLTLNAKCDLTGIFEVAHGTVSVCPTTPREIFSRALLVGATHVILIHNHPSGHPEPSSEDLNLTKMVKQAGKLIGIELIDHIIIGDNCFFSFCDKDIFENL